MVVQPVNHLKRFYLPRKEHLIGVNCKEDYLRISQSILEQSDGANERTQHLR